MMEGGRGGHAATAEGPGSWVSVVLVWRTTLTREGREGGVSGLSAECLRGTGRGDGESGKEGRE